MTPWEKRDAIASALKSAFDDEVSLLFKNLVDGLASEREARFSRGGPDSRERFEKGFALALEAYDVERSKLCGQNPV